MSIALILAVGQDLLLLDTRSSILRAAGYIVESALSVTQAIHHFQTGDFDMVLLCHSIPVEERNRLTSAIRAFGSGVPVAVVAPVSQECPHGFEDALLENHPKELLEGIEKALLCAATSWQSKEPAHNRYPAERLPRHTISCVDDPEGQSLRRRMLENAG